MPRAPQTASPKNVLNVLKRNAMSVLSATSESMFAVRCVICFAADT